MPKKSKPLTTPKKLIDVLGDGNCWYRCISLWINGSEEHHELVRLKLYQFFMTDNRVRAYVGDIDSYLDINPLNVIGTWATDVEIFATALMLNTNIYIYSDYHKSWQLFGKNGNYKDGVRVNENCLYMCHINRNHYSVVADVNDK
ncbi:uncharacterized protein LOC107882322 [Acyrthosiphon pisum]|uniref:OTU domain-containing protein n=1 Tax=Acyrthosiphon pisum TaxID=7029 RepID=A0A8R2D215_ACYPI|nr:uncharacterized protein LOC107882322 [Acyrthosiphon pisum]|eukprot:XP_016656023.1 PREDICTED: uncharacterized protein LOC107882322 [Acyrthosiphon pisum]